MQFDEQSVKRIAKTVQRVEREAFPQRRRARQRFTPFGDTLPTVPCVNSSGFVIPPYGLVKRSGASGANVTCVRPDAAWGVYLVNGASEVPIGAEFRAHAAGLVTVASSGGGSASTLCPVPNTFTVRAHGPLIQLLAPAGTDLKLGVLDPPQVLFGKPQSNIAAGGSGQMILHDQVRTAISPQLTVTISWAAANLTTTSLMSAVYHAGAWFGLPAECTGGAAAAPATGDGVEFGAVLGIESLGV